MRLMILENRQLRSTMRANDSTVSIGSSPQCGVHLPDSKISAHQASLTLDDDGSWWLEVLDTSIPTCLNRAVQRGRSKLRHADEIEMGSFAIRLFMESVKTREEIRRERMAALSERHGRSLPLGTVVHKFDDDMTVSKEHLEQMTLLAIRLEQADHVGDLMTPLIRFMLRTFEGRCAWVGIRKTGKGDFDWTLGLQHNGQPCERPPFSEGMQTRCLAHTQYLCVPEVPAADIGSAMAVPLACQSGNLGILYVENAPKDPRYDEASLKVLSAMACCTAMPVEDGLRRATAKHRQTVATEQTIARVTQDALTPRALPEWDDLQVAAYRHMGSARCCDFYDVVQLRDRTASVIVARLMVKDAVLPRYFSELRATFRAAALYAEPPHLFARALNWIIYDGNVGLAIDLVSIWVAPGSGKVQYCMAGNGVGLGRIRSDGTCQPLESQVGPRVGQTRAPVFTPGTLELSAGDTLVLSTAGVDTATNADGQVLGRTGLEENLCDGLGDTPGNVLSEFATDLAEYIAGGGCTDDLTVLLLQRR